MDKELINMRLNACRAALDLIPSDAKVIGIGTGTTISQFIEYAEKRGLFKDKLIVASSYDTSLKLRKLGIRVIDILSIDHIDVYIDSADEVDVHRNMIKGGGAALTMEKILTKYSDLRIFIVDERKIVDKVPKNKPIPADVIPSAVSLISKYLRKIGIKAEIRMSEVGRRGPILSDFGGVIVDLYLEKGVNLMTINETLNSIPGIIEHGLFIDLADYVVIGKTDQVDVIKR